MGHLCRHVASTAHHLSPVIPHTPTVHLVHWGVLATLRGIVVHPREISSRYMKVLFTPLQRFTALHSHSHCRLLRLKQQTAGHWQWEDLGCPHLNIYYNSKLYQQKYALKFAHKLALVLLRDVNFYFH